MDQYVLGLDFGTESVRAGVVDVQGRVIGTATSPYVTKHPQPGYAEQDPREWWTAAALAVRNALMNARVPRDAIVGIAADCTSCSVVLCRKDGTPLRPALIWMDVRAQKEAEDVAATDDPALMYHHGRPPSAEWMAPKVLWLARHEPHVLQQAEVVCEFTDWIAYQCTGRWTTSHTNATMRWHYNVDRGGWPVTLYRTLQLEDVLYRFPQEVLSMGQVVGPLHPRAAEWLGLRPGILVAEGAADAYVAMLGLGVIAPGQVGVVGGSSHCHIGIAWRNTSAVPGLFGPYPEAIIPGYSVFEGGQVSTGSVLHWYVQQVLGRSDYKDLDRQAAELPPGSDGVLVLEYWQGNRTPYTDATASGLIYGLRLGHDYRHIYRAILEAVAFGTTQLLERFQQADVNPPHIPICGGVTQSNLWLQIHADAAGRRFLIPEEPNSAMLGSAILAAIATGLHPNIESAVRSMVRYEREVVPDLNKHQRYERPYRLYCTAYPYIRAWAQSTRT